MDKSVCIEISGTEAPEELLFVRTESFDKQSTSVGVSNRELSVAQVQ